MNLRDRYTRFLSEIKEAKKAFSLYHRRWFESLKKGPESTSSDDLMMSIFVLSVATEGHFEKARVLIEEIDPYSQIEVDPDYAEMVNQCKPPMRGLLLSEMARIEFLKDAPSLPRGLDPDHPEGTVYFKDGTDDREFKKVMGEKWDKAKIAEWSKELNNQQEAVNAAVNELNNRLNQQRIMKENLAVKYPELEGP